MLASYEIQTVRVFFSLNGLINGLEISTQTEICFCFNQKVLKYLSFHQVVKENLSAGLILMLLTFWTVVKQVRESPYLF